MKKKKFDIPGIYHRLTVKLVSKKWIQSRFKDKGTVYMAFYLHHEGLIYIARELSPEVKKHTIYHEISHHIRDTLEDIKDEEPWCDLLGSYLMKLVEEKEHIETSLLQNEENL